MGSSGGSGGRSNLPGAAVAVALTGLLVSPGAGIHSAWSLPAPAMAASPRGAPGLALLGGALDRVVKDFADGTSEWEVSGW